MNKVIMRISLLVLCLTMSFVALTSCGKKQEKTPTPNEQEIVQPSPSPNYGNGEIPL